MQTTIDGIKVTYDEAIPSEELNEYINQEKQIWQAKGRELGSMIIKLDGNEVEIESHAASHITRIRRITGYLSTADNFNDAKRAELNNRYKHA